MQSARAWWSRALTLAALLCALSAGGLSHHSARPIPGTHNHPSAVLAGTLAAAELASDQTPRVELSETRTLRHPASTASSPAAADVEPVWHADSDDATLADPAYANHPGTSRGRAPPLLI